MKVFPVFIPGVVTVPVTNFKAAVPINERRMGKAMHVLQGHVSFAIGQSQNEQGGFEPQGNSREPCDGVEKMLEAADLDFVKGDGDIP